MQEALVAFVVLVIGAVIGACLSPTEAEMRPLYPEVSAGGGHGDDHGHHH